MAVEVEPEQVDQSEMEVLVQSGLGETVCLALLDIDDTLEVFMNYGDILNLNKSDKNELLEILDGLQATASRVCSRDLPKPNREPQLFWRLICLRGTLKEEVSPLVTKMDDNIVENLPILLDQVEQFGDFCITRLQGCLPHDTSLTIVFDIVVNLIAILSQYIAAILYLVLGFNPGGILTLAIMYIPAIVIPACQYAIMCEDKIGSCRTEWLYIVLPVRRLRYALSMIRQRWKLNELAGDNTELVNCERYLLTKMRAQLNEVFRYEKLLETSQILDLHLKSAPQFLLQTYYLFVLMNTLGEDNVILRQCLTVFVGFAALSNLVLQSWDGLVCHFRETSSTRTVTIPFLLAFLALEGARTGMFAFILYSGPLYAISIACVLRIVFLYGAAVLKTLISFKHELDDSSMSVLRRVMCKPPDFVGALMRVWTLCVAVVSLCVSTSAVVGLLPALCTAAIDIGLQCAIWGVFSYSREPSSGPSFLKLQS